VLLLARDLKQPEFLQSGVAQQVIALPERAASRRRIEETVQEVADLGKDYELLKLQCATLKKQFGVLLQQLDEMAKNVNAVVKDQDAAATVVEAAGVVEDNTSLASLNSREYNLIVDSRFIAF
jgi:hypothetical protein